MPAYDKMMTMKSNTLQIHNFLNIICIDQSSFSFDVQQMDFEYKIFSSIYVALDKRKSIGKNIVQVTMVILYQFEYFSFDFPVKMLIKKQGKTIHLIEIHLRVLLIEKHFKKNHLEIKAFTFCFI